MELARGRSHSRRVQLLRRGVWGALLGAALPLAMLAGVAQASSTGPTPGPHPAPGAPSSTWSAWSAQQAQQQAHFPWSAMASAAGCSFVESGARTSSGAAPGSPIPAGIEVPTGWAVVHCPPGRSLDNSVRERGTAPAATTSASPQVSPACNTVTGPGSICVSLGTYNSAYYVFGSYLYDGSYTTGHVELSDDGVTSCGYPGTLLADSANVALHSGDEVITDYPYEFSADYDSTFWQGGPPWNDWGNACSSY